MGEIMSNERWWNHWTGKVGGLGHETIPGRIIFDEPHKYRTGPNPGLHSKRTATIYLFLIRTIPLCVIMQ